MRNDYMVAADRTEGVAVLESRIVYSVSELVPVDRGDIKRQWQPPSLPDGAAGSSCREGADSICFSFLTGTMPGLNKIAKLGGGLSSRWRLRRS